MTPDTWIGIAIGGLVMTFVWGLGLCVVIAAIGAGRTTIRDTPMDGRTYYDDDGWETPHDR